VGACMLHAGLGPHADRVLHRPGPGHGECCEGDDAGNQAPVVRTATWEPPPTPTLETPNPNPAVHPLPSRCQWHLGKSLATNVRPKLGESFDAFLAEWYALNTILSEAAFTAEWERLLEEYPEASAYLERSLGGENLKHWGLPFQVGTQHLTLICSPDPKTKELERLTGDRTRVQAEVYTAGTKATTRSEGLNTHVKRSIGKKADLTQVLEAVSNRVYRQEERCVRVFPWPPGEGIGPTPNPKGT
jgi:hypothetical protein